MSDNKRGKKLEQARAMLAKAASTEFEGEAAVFRAKADEIMANFAIEQWELDEADESANRKGRDPERRDVNIAWYFEPQYRHVYADMWGLFGNVSRHCRCKVVWWGGYATKHVHPSQQTVPVLGLPSDLDYFDLLFTHLQIQLFNQIQPGVQEGDTYIEALVRMKEAGMKWEAIADKLIKAGLTEGPYTRNMGVRFTKEYTQYCNETGRERKYINPKTYQRSFTEGFCAQVSHRLAEQKADQKAKGGSGMELAIIDIKKMLEEEAVNQFGREPLMDCTYHTQDYGSRTPRLHFEDGFGNRGDVYFPYERDRGWGRINVGSEWKDAVVDTWCNHDGGADEVGAAAEFLLHLAHVAKTLDLAFAADKERVVGAMQREQAERERREQIAARALQMRCEELAQYYMQLVRVQREGHSSNAKGELHVVMLREGQEDQAFQRRMYLKESNGNRWEFQADAVAKFEVKDGNRYDTIKLTPMETLRAQASVELNEEVAA